MKLSEIRSLMKANGYKTTDELNRFDVKRFHGEPIGVDIMLANGTVAYLTIPTEES